MDSREGRESRQAIQDLVPSNCFGCGSQNEVGHQIKSYWDGAEAVCTWTPKPYHTGGPGFLYGGIVASLIDCHCGVAAVAAAYDAEGRTIGSEPRIWYVTANLNVDYIRPTPIDGPVELRARVERMEGRKSFLTCALFSQGKECARATAIFVRLP